MSFVFPEAGSHRRTRAVSKSLVELSYLVRKTLGEKEPALVFVSMCPSPRQSFVFSPL